MDFRTARKNMVETQVMTNDVVNLELLDAMREAPRERFCAPGREFAAYAEVEPEVSPGRFLMRPRDIGKLLQAIGPRPGESALAIAAPYAAAVMAQMGLTVTAQEADARAGAVVGPALEDAGVRLVLADLHQPEGGDWDIVVCEQAVSQIPDAWIQALKVGGRLGCVVRNGPVGKAKLVVRTAAGQSGREAFDSTPPILPGFEKIPSFQF
jgi:protein-L-isoaspartate(D-aspartate) O-methyltransferase